MRVFALPGQGGVPDLVFIELEIIPAEGCEVTGKTLPRLTLAYLRRRSLVLGDELCREINTQPLMDGVRALVKAQDLSWLLRFIHSESQSLWPAILAVSIARGLPDGCSDARLCELLATAAGLLQDPRYSGPAATASRVALAWQLAQATAAAENDPAMALLRAHLPQLIQEEKRHHSTQDESSLFARLSGRAGSPAVDLLLQHLVPSAELTRSVADEITFRLFRASSPASAVSAGAGIAASRPPAGPNLIQEYLASAEFRKFQRAVGWAQAEILVRDPGAVGEVPRYLTLSGLPPESRVNLPPQRLVLLPGGGLAWEEHPPPADFSKLIEVRERSDEHQAEVRRDQSRFIATAQRRIDQELETRRHAGFPYTLIPDGEIAFCTLVWLLARAAGQTSSVEELCDWARLDSGHALPMKPIFEPSHATLVFAADQETLLTCAALFELLGLAVGAGTGAMNPTPRFRSLANWLASWDTLALSERPSDLEKFFRTPLAPAFAVAFGGQQPDLPAFCAALKSTGLLAEMKELAASHPRLPEQIDGRTRLVTLSLEFLLRESEPLPRHLVVFPLLPEASTELAVKSGQYPTAVAVVTLQNAGSGAEADAPDSRDHALEAWLPALGCIRTVTTQLALIGLRETFTRGLASQVRAIEQHALRRGWSHAMKNSLLPVNEAAERLKNTAAPLHNLLERLVQITALQMRYIEKALSEPPEWKEFEEPLKDFAAGTLIPDRQPIRSIPMLLQHALLDRPPKLSRALMQLYTDDPEYKSAVAHFRQQFVGVQSLEETVDTLRRIGFVARRLNEEHNALLRMEDERPCELVPHEGGHTLDLGLAAGLNQAFLAYRSILQDVLMPDGYKQSFASIIAPDEGRPKENSKPAAVQGFERGFKPILDAWQSKTGFSGLLGDYDGGGDFPFFLSISAEQRILESLAVPLVSDAVRVCAVLLAEGVSNIFKHGFRRSLGQPLRARIALLQQAHRNQDFLALCLSNPARQDDLRRLSPLSGTFFSGHNARDAYEEFTKAAMTSFVSHLKYIAKLTDGKGGIEIDVGHTEIEVSFLIPLCQLTAKMLETSDG